jgi:hypothetical protein
LNAVDMAIIIISIPVQWIPPVLNPVVAKFLLY